MDEMDAIRRSLRRHDAFEAGPGTEYVLTTTAFDAIAALDDGLQIVVTVPTLAGATVESVDSVVDEGWIDTFERRVEDPSTATRTDAIETAVERDGDAVHVRVHLQPAPDMAADEAKAAADFVEGTWVQSAVPGYEYAPPAKDILARAKERGSTA